MTKQELQAENRRLKLLVARLTRIRQKQHKRAEEFKLGAQCLSDRLCEAYDRLEELGDTQFLYQEYDYPTLELQR